MTSQGAWVPARSVGSSSVSMGGRDALISPFQKYFMTQKAHPLSCLLLALESRFPFIKGLKLNDLSPDRQALLLCGALLANRGLLHDMDPAGTFSLRRITCNEGLAWVVFTSSWIRADPIQRCFPRILLDSSRVRLYFYLSPACPLLTWFVKTIICS